MSILQSGISIVEGTSSQTPIQVSKWLRTQLLINTEELKILLDLLAPFSLHHTGRVLPQESLTASTEMFLSNYDNYLTHVRNGTVNMQEWSREFALALTAEADAIFSVPIGEDKAIVRVARPIMQIQHHLLHYSSDDHKFRSTVIGQGTISWGLQISYPQLFLDPMTAKVHKLRGDESFPNAQRFRDLQRWIRIATVATPFRIDGKVITSSVRTGKECLSWVAGHPQLQERGIEVVL